MCIRDSSNSFVKDPHTVVKAGQIVKVKVLEVDLQRQRIALSMRMGDEPTQGKRHDAAPVNGGGNQQRPPRPAGYGASGSSPLGGQRNSSSPDPSGNAMAHAFAKLKR